MLLRNKFFSSKIVAAFLGTIIEYYDYTLYGFAAGVLALKFLPHSTDYITNLTKSFVIYYVAYFAKPLGSIIFGRIGDLYGRKLALSITIIGISIPTTMIGLLPEYEIIGIWSVIILIICRFVQGIFVGGEYDGAAIYVIEHLGDKYRFTASAITRSMGALGLLLGIATTNFFNAHIFPSWSWRIPFVLSLPLSFVSLYFRSKMIDPDIFIKCSNPAHSIISIIKKRWLIICLIILFAGSVGAMYQIGVILMRHYLPIVLPSSQSVISVFSIIGVLCFAIAMPLSGIFADYFGAKVVIFYSSLSGIVAVILLVVAIKLEMLNLLIASYLLIVFSIAPSSGIVHGIIVNLLSVSQRYRVISLGHTIGSVLLSGSANYICLKCMAFFNFRFFPVVYLGFFIILSFVLNLVCNKIQDT